MPFGDLPQLVAPPFHLRLFSTCAGSIIPCCYLPVAIRCECDDKLMLLVLQVQKFYEVPSFFSCICLPSPYGQLLIVLAHSAAAPMLPIVLAHSAAHSATGELLQATLTLT